MNNTAKKKMEEAQKCLHILNVLKSHMGNLEALGLGELEEKFLKEALSHINHIGLDLIAIRDGMGQEAKQKKSRGR